MNTIATNSKITFLPDDIRKIVLKAYGEKFEMIRLCKDHHDPYLLYDKKPVLNIVQDQFVGIFDLNFSHYFLSPFQVYRLGAYCKLDLPNLIAFMLKAEWELFLSEMSGYLKGQGRNLRSILNDQEIVSKCISEFRPDHKEIFNILKNNSNGSDVRILYSQINFFVMDLLDHSIFLGDNENVGNIYPGEDVTEKILLQRIPETQRENYIRQKELWVLRSSELDDLLLYFERRKRLNLGIENKYFRTFGELEAEKSRFSFRLEKYKIILEIMGDHPEFSYRELIKKAYDRLAGAEKERNDLRSKIARSHNCIGDLVNESSMSPITDEFRNSYSEACKKLLRKLFFLLHTDTCPNYSLLSHQKKTEINKLWLKLMKSTKEELYSFSPTMLLYSLPDYEQLKAIYWKACEILDMNPEDFETGNRLEFMINKGTSIQAILEFLKSETKQLEFHLANLELVQNEYTHEDESRFYTNSLANISAHSENLKSEIAGIKNRISLVKKEIYVGFAKTAG